MHKPPLGYPFDRRTNQRSQNIAYDSSHKNLNLKHLLQKTHFWPPSKDHWQPRIAKTIKPMRPSFLRSRFDYHRLTTHRYRNEDPLSQKTYKNTRETKRDLGTLDRKKQTHRPQPQRLNTQNGEHRQTQKRQTQKYIQTNAYTPKYP